MYLNDAVDNRKGLSFMNFTGDSLDDGVVDQPEAAGKRLYVFTKAELSEVSGQDIDLDNDDEFYERDNAHIITLGRNSSMLINRENIKWELIKLLRKKVVSCCLEYVLDEPLV
jgi:hypothetical protein